MRWLTWMWLTGCGPAEEVAEAPEAAPIAPEVEAEPAERLAIGYRGPFALVDDGLVVCHHRSVVRLTRQLELVSETPDQGGPTAPCTADGAVALWSQPGRLLATVDGKPEVFLTGAPDLVQASLPKVGERLFLDSREGITAVDLRSRSMWVVATTSGPANLRAVGPDLYWADNDGVHVLRDAGNVPRDQRALRDTVVVERDVVDFDADDGDLVWLLAPRTGRYEVWTTRGDEVVRVWKGDSKREPKVLLAGGVVLFTVPDRDEVHRLDPGAAQPTRWLWDMDWVRHWDADDEQLYWSGRELARRRLDAPPAAVPPRDSKTIGQERAALGNAHQR